MSHSNANEVLKISRSKRVRFCQENLEHKFPGAKSITTKNIISIHTTLFLSLGASPDPPVNTYPTHPTHRKKSLSRDQPPTAENL